MIPTTKGQTALEYLLIVVVAIIVVVAVMVWMNQMAASTTQQAGETGNVILCEVRACGLGCDAKDIASPCYNLSVTCGPDGTCAVEDQ